jgi:pimeloyl-ACP methyl ester carboxylesterase
LPIILTHGWPGSVIEMLNTIGPLADPTAHGGSAQDAFHVVIPSIPGYGFSGRPTDLGWGPERVARAWDVLMKRLGYAQYVSQGGDHGSVISDALARQQPAGLLAIHVNMPPTIPAEYVKAINAGDPPPGLPESERIAFETLSRFFARNAAYGALMVTRPQTIGYALCDSPVALAAFMYEKIAEWTDSGGHGRGRPFRGVGTAAAVRVRDAGGIPAAARDGGLRERGARTRARPPIRAAAPAFRRKPLARGRARP